MSYPVQTTSGTLTTFFPVTTAWPSVPECATIVWQNAEFTQYYDMYDPGYGLSAAPGVSCLPPAATIWWENKDGTTPVYSIGPIVCPEDFTTAATSMNGPSSTWVACCPLAFSFSGSQGGGHVGECVSTIIPGQTFNVAMEVDSLWTTAVSTAVTGSFMSAAHLNGWNIAGLAAVVQTSVPSTSSPTHTPSTISPSVHPPLSTSISSPTNPSSPTSQSSTSSSATTSGAPAPTITNPSSTTSSPGLPTSILQGGSSTVGQNNTSKNVAIGVGVSFSVIGLSCAAFAVWFVTKKNRSAQRVGQNNPWPGMAAGPGYAQLSQAHLRHEMESKENSISRYEMDVRGERLRPGEMP